MTLERTVKLLWAERERVKTITADNGTEFHNYRELESMLGTEVYFATPHHAWERGTNENTNGLIRQYLPKGTNLEPPHPTAMRPHCRTVKQPPQTKTRLQNPQRSLLLTSPLLSHYKCETKRQLRHNSNQTRHACYALLKKQCAPNINRSADNEQ